MKNTFCVKIPFEGPDYESSNETDQNGVPYSWIFSQCILGLMVCSFREDINQSVGIVFRSPKLCGSTTKNKTLFSIFSLEAVCTRLIRHQIQQGALEKEEVSILACTNENAFRFLCVTFP